MNPSEEMRQWFIQNFHQKGESYVLFLCKSTVASNLFMSKYKDFPPIETLDPEAKTEMKKYAHEMFPGESVEFKLRACKIIYCLGTMI